MSECFHHSWLPLCSILWDLLAGGVCVFVPGALSCVGETIARTRWRVGRCEMKGGGWPAVARPVHLLPSVSCVCISLFFARRLDPQIVIIRRREKEGRESTRSLSLKAEILQILLKFENNTAPVYSPQAQNAEMRVISRVSNVAEWVALWADLCNLQETVLLVRRVLLVLRTRRRRTRS